MKEDKLPSYAQLIEYYQTTNGLYMIDRDPHEVDIDWIRENAFKPKLLDENKLPKSVIEDVDIFFNGKYLREKLVFSLLANWGAQPNITIVAENLHNYIISGNTTEYIANKMPQEYFIRKDVDEIGEAHIKSEKDIANSKD